jgi:Ricin-type beta-trefoil lectin domain
MTRERPTAGPSISSVGFTLVELSSFRQAKLAVATGAKCLNDYGRDTAAGAPVKLYTCSSDPASQWVTYPGNTFRPDLNQTMALTDVGGKIVLEPVSGTAAQTWFYRGDGALLNGSSPGTGLDNLALNDPGFNTANGTQLVDFNQGWAISNARSGPGTTTSMLRFLLIRNRRANWFGRQLGRPVSYAADFLPTNHRVSRATSAPVPDTWKRTGYQLMLSVPMVPLSVPDYSGPPAPRVKISRQHSWPAPKAAADGV